LTIDPDFSGPGPWSLPVVSFELARLDFGFPLTFIAAADAGRRFRVQLSGVFTFRDGHGQDHELDPEKDSWEHFTVLFELRHDRIGRAIVSADMAWSSPAFLDT